LPDERLMKRLEVNRGRGRDDYPIRPLWNALIAGIVFNHPTVAPLIRELRRNAELRQLCGFDPRRAGGSPRMGLQSVSLAPHGPSVAHRSDAL
jgi:hypothetical protein